MKIRLQKSLSAALSLALSSCMVGPDFEPPLPVVPETFQNASATLAPELVELAWWKNFHDPVLESLVERSRVSNLTIAQAQSRILQTRERMIIVQADLFPSLNGSANYSRTGRGDSGGGQGVTTVVGGQAISGGSGNNIQELYRSGFDAAWEIDLFGRNRRALEAADAELMAAIEDSRAVIVSLTAEVATRYVTLRGLQAQLDVARKNLQVQSGSADIAQKRYAVGFSDMLAVSSIKAEVATTSSQIPNLESQVEQQIYALSVLLGTSPTTLLPELLPPQNIPQVTETLAVGVPSELLRRRPDIRRAEERLHAATAQIGVAVGDLFPQLTLTASLRLQDTIASSSLDWQNHIWNLGAGLVVPIFQGGRLRAAVRLNEAITEEARLQYQQTVLTALQETETSLVALAKERERRVALADAVIHNRRAYDAASALYREGLGDYLNVLTAQRSLFATELLLAQSDQAIANNIIAVYKALGGGWH